MKKKHIETASLPMVFLYSALCACSCLIYGCATPVADHARPIEYIVAVSAEKTWQPSGVFAKKGEIICCVATGNWSDAFSKYDAGGNPAILKSHLGTEAPVSSLIMRIGNWTNLVYYAGRQTNIVAGGSGELKFRNNFSVASNMSGQIIVRVTASPDADGDGVSDYDEINIWKTDPLRADSDGDGISDLEKINDRRHLSVPAAGSE